MLVGLSGDVQLICVFENRCMSVRRSDYSQNYTSGRTPDDVLVCNMLFETFGRMNISEINPPMIEKFKQKRLEGKTMYKRKRNPATVNRELCVLSKIFSLACDAELMDSNPCRGVRKFRTDTRRTRYLTFEEEDRLFENWKVRNGYSESSRWRSTPECDKARFLVSPGSTWTSHKD
jgi:site-specific recombinase XerD